MAGRGVFMVANTYWHNLRVKNNLTTKEVAEFIGVSEGTVSQYFNGKSRMPTATIYKLADFFGVNAEEAMNETVNLQSLYFHGDMRSRKPKKVKEEPMNDISTNQKDYIKIIKYSDLEKLFIHVINLLSLNDSDLLVNADGEIMYLTDKLEEIKQYVNEHSSTITDAESNNIAVLTRQINTLIRRINLAIERNEEAKRKAEEDAILPTPVETYSPVLTKEEPITNTKTDLYDKIMDILYGKLTRDEYEEVSKLLKEVM